MRDNDSILLESIYSCEIINESDFSHSLFREMGFLDQKEAIEKIKEFFSKYGADIVNFAMGLYIYQSSYMEISPERMYKLYMRLTPKQKKKYTPDPETLQTTRRGDDSVKQKKAISFASHSNPEIAMSNAKFFGGLVFAIEDLESYDGAFSTELFVNDPSLSDMVDFLNIGDDENEIIVFGAKWKKEVYDTKQNYEPNELYEIVLRLPRNPLISDFIGRAIKGEKPEMPDELLNELIKNVNNFGSSLGIFIVKLMNHGIEIPQKLFEFVAEQALETVDYFVRSLVISGYEIPPVIYDKILSNNNTAFNIAQIMLSKNMKVPDEMVRAIIKGSSNYEIPFIYNSFKNTNVKIPQSLETAYQKVKEREKLYK